MDEYKKRRSKMLSFYPEVAAAGNLADALSRAFADQGSSLNGYSVVPPDQPNWSIFSDHPAAPGTTVPEFARVKARKRVCQVKIGWFEVPLGAYHLDLFDSYDWDEIGHLDGWARTDSLVTTAHVIRRTFEHHVGLRDAADEFGVVSHQLPRSKDDDAIHEYLSMSEEERECERQMEGEREYQILGLPEERVRELLGGLTEASSTSVCNRRSSIGSPTLWNAILRTNLPRRGEPSRDSWTGSNRSLSRVRATHEVTRCLWSW